jgi:undecaprenyl-diphosphatase
MSATVLSVAAVACFAACAALGAYVRAHPASRLDALAVRLRGRATRLAAFFTRLGRWYAVLGLGILAALVAQLTGSGALLVVALLVSQILAQGVISRVKALVRRPRPDRWLVRFEPDLSYPSGHSATSIIFFLPLAYLALHARFVPPLVADSVAAALGACVIGIPWSRMALAAHYATDVIGGILFGGGWLCATLAIIYR